jgi:hypothetical protein
MHRWDRDVLDDLLNAGILAVLADEVNARHAA